MNRIFTLFAFCAISMMSYGQTSLDDMKFGKGMINFTAKDNSFSVKFAPRFQFRYYADYNDNRSSDVLKQTFTLRRARLKFDGFAYSPNLRYKLELGLSNDDLSGANKYTKNAPRMILDAVIMWRFAENWDLWAGQTKLPGNVERVVSSANLQFIDRSLLNSYFNLDRDIGIQIRHTDAIGENFVIKEKFALSQGEGRNITTGNVGGLQYTGRVEFLPMGEFTKKGDYSQADLEREKKPKLMLACTYDFNNNSVKTRSVLGSYMELNDGSLYKTDITTIFADAVFKYNGFSFQGEYANRNSSHPSAINSAGVTEYTVEDGQAVNLQAGYLFKSDIEVVGRYTDVEFNDYTGAKDRQQYTIGASKYLKGHKLKVQADLSKTVVNSIAEGYLFRMGFDIHF